MAQGKRWWVSTNTWAAWVVGKVAARQAAREHGGGFVYAECNCGCGKSASVPIMAKVAPLGVS